MIKQNTNSKKGFTIIEVVLVLAIAGLIFLMVFIAWPALQRNQRDTQRRNDYSMLSTAISGFITNNGGKLEKIMGTTSGDNRKQLAANTYINKEGVDPDGKQYLLYAVRCTGNNGDVCSNKNIPKTPSARQVFVVVNADCSGSADGHSAPKHNDSIRAFAIYGYLEGGNKSFCSDSQ